MSIATEIARLQTAKADLKTSIENKGVVVQSTAKLDEYSALVDQISTGGSGCAKNDVTFYDYDGTIVCSYSASEFLSLESMPDNPFHSGLTSQGWNWGIADAKEYVTNYGTLDIGHTYTTNDGKTRIYVHMENGRLHPYLGICPDGTVEVDWGDNSAVSTMTGSSLTTVQVADHTYETAGDYVITLTILNGKVRFSGSTNVPYILRKNNTTSANIHRVYSNCVYKAHIGSNVEIGNNAFIQCNNLLSITIPKSVIGIGSSAFQNCNSLMSITIPDGIISIDSNAFGACYNLSSVMMPNSLMNIGSSAFQNCNKLSSVTIPGSVNSIANYAFNSCFGLSDVIVPNNVTDSGQYTFGSCYSLSNIVIPDSVTGVGNSTFSSCYGLVSVTMSNNSTSISNNAFSACYSIASITVPSSVTRIGGSAFSNCYGVTEYHMLPTTPPTLESTSAFTGIQSECLIYVPTESLEAYKTASNWSTYADRMVGE